MASAHPNTVGGSMHLYSSINTEKKEKKKKIKHITVRVLKGFREEGQSKRLLHNKSYRSYGVLNHPPLVLPSGVHELLLRHPKYKNREIVKI